jgi:hypothetical protein
MKINRKRGEMNKKVEGAAGVTFTTICSFILVFLQVLQSQLKILWSMKQKQQKLFNKFVIN